MKDLGLNPFRKSSVFEEWFVRYKPSDYRTILDEYRNIRCLQLKGQPLNGNVYRSRDFAEETNGYAVETK
jgi:dimethylaniline monooxygenase (N-oxide forming)